MVLILVLAVIISGSASAATINVHPGTNSIKNAITKAHPGDTLKLSSGTYNEHNLVVNKGLSITGPTVVSNTPSAIIDGQKKGKVFTIKYNSKVLLQNLWIKNGKNNEFGGGIENYGQLTISRCKFTKNYGLFGAGVCNWNTASVSGTSFSENTGNKGGAIFNDWKTTITSCDINNNMAKFGGGIYNDGTMTIKSCDINNNKADTDGAAIYNDEKGNLIITGSKILNNKGSTYQLDSSISNSYGKVSAHYNQIYSNNAYEVYNFKGTVNAENNWWGSNQNPSSKISTYQGKVYFKPWLTTPFFITSTDPLNGSTNIAPNKTIKVTFSETVKALNQSLIELKNSDGQVISFQASTKDNLLYINPNSNLSESVYTMIIHTGAVTDLSSNPIAKQTIKFTAGIPPKVSSTSPINKKTGVSRTAIINIKFSENIYSSTYYGKITVKNLTTGKLVNITKSINGNTLYIKNSSKRSAYTWYQVTIPAGAVKDKPGNKLAATYTFIFKTGG